MKDENLIFLLSTERGGSNLITKMLDAHSEINGPTTKHLLNPLLRNYHRYTPFTDESWGDLVDDLLNLYNVDFSKWRFDPKKEKLLDEVPFSDVSQLAMWFFKNERLNNGKFSSGNKLKVTPSEFELLLKYKKIHA